MGRQDCGLAAPELLLLRHWTILSCTTPWHGLFSFTWTCYSTDLHIPRASITVIWRVPQTEPRPDKARSLRLSHPVMLMHKGWNDVCTASLCVLEWFMWLCDLNVNFCECLTAQDLETELENKSTTRPSYPHLYGSWYIHRSQLKHLWYETHLCLSGGCDSPCTDGTDLPLSVNHHLE